MNLSVFGKKQVSTDEVMKDYLRMVRALCTSDRIPNMFATNILVYRTGHQIRCRVP